MLFVCYQESVWNFDDKKNSGEKPVVDVSLFVIQQRQVGLYVPNQPYERETNQSRTKAEKRETDVHGMAAH